MKNLSILIALLIAGFSSNGAIHTVDNTLGSGAQFSSIASAINAANSGDTILVHASGASYGNVDITKKVHLVGPGFNPEITNGLTASVNIFGIANGSTGSVIEGFQVNQFLGALFGAADSITIRNNLIQSSSAIRSNYGSWSDSDYWIIEGNSIIDAGGCGGCTLINVDDSQDVSDNWIIRNNIIQIASGGNGFFRNLNPTTTVLNNIIIHRSTADLFQDSNGATLASNIFYSNNGINDMTVECSGCSFENNLFYTNNNDHVEVEGNIVNEDPLFVEIANGNPVYNFANNYNLQNGSPAAGTGEAGTDMGVYGANYNFRDRGYPNSHPRMTSVLPSFIAVPEGETFDVEIEAVRAGQ